MALRPQTFTKGSLVDKHINTAYDTVKVVSDNIEDVIIVANGIAHTIIVGDNITDVVTVSESIDDVNTVADDINNGKIDAAIAAAISTAADLVLTNADVVLTHADVVTSADLLDQFQDIYLGPFASAPTLDLDGDPLADGMIYWNTGTNVLGLYNGSAWIYPQTDASDSATAAETAQTAAELALDQFTDQYLGPKAVEPTLDNDGDALLEGALYYNTSDKKMKVYDGTVWTNLSTVAALSFYEYTATAGQTVISGLDDNSKTLSYPIGFITVALNGRELHSADYTATDGISITVTPMDVDDTIRVTVYETIGIADTYTKTEIDNNLYTRSEAEALFSSHKYRSGLAKLIHPDQSKGLQELQRQGVFPTSFQQQWGGMGFGGLPDGTLGEVATGYIIQDNAQAIGAGTTSTYTSQGFKVGQSSDIASVWLKIFKEGNPTNNLELYIYDDNAGEPNALITNGTATAQNGKLHTDNSDGEWIKFIFATNPSLVAGTQYHIILKSSGAVDASNFWRWLITTDSTYPHGDMYRGDATPAWIILTGQASVFLIEPVTNILQSGLSGFDGALHCYEGAPLDQSGAFYFANTELNHKRGMIHFAGTGFTKDKAIYDSGLGTDNNRIVIRTNVTTGYAQVDLYENDENKLTVTGVTDISTGNHIVSAGYRSEGDGSDFLKLYIDGVSEGIELISQTITLDRAFEDGHTAIGGGFPLAPAWTQNMDMSVLPSADGWTWTGTATEANAMVVDGGILYQNGAGYASTDSGYYEKTTTLDNAVGWAVESKIQHSEGSDSTSGISLSIYVQDGTKEVYITMNSYYLNVHSGQVYVQYDFTKETTIKIIGKGSDYYIYIDGKLLVDGTGLLTNTTATNGILFGDISTSAGNNSTAQWSYFKYYEGAYLPEYSDVQISEFAQWNDDKSSLLSTIYNLGDIQPVKALAGMNENYVKTVKYKGNVWGITSDPTTALSTFTVLDEMSIFCFGKSIDIDFNTSNYNSVISGAMFTSASIDGVSTGILRDSSFITDQTTGIGMMPYQDSVQTQYGLHYVAGLWRATTGTMTNFVTRRTLKVEAE